MKEFAAFILLIVLVLVGWSQPYKAHFGRVTGNPPAVPAAPADGPPAAAPPARAVPQATPARDNSWLWKKTSMDEPHADKGNGKHAH